MKLALGPAKSTRLARGGSSLQQLRFEPRHECYEFAHCQSPSTGNLSAPPASPQHACKQSQNDTYQEY